MKKILVAIIPVILCIAAAAQAKKEKDSLPYQKYPTLPAFKLQLQDSSTVFNMYYVKEGRPTVLFYFSPECEHCQIAAKALIGGMDSMSNADFYFFTFMPLSALRPFAVQYHLNDYKNIIVGKDYQFFFPAFYGAASVPYLVVYDRHKKLVRLYDGHIKTPELISLLRSL